MNDYYKDGLLYCGKCNTPKEYKINVGYLSGQVKPIMCKCASASYEREKQEREQRERFEKVQRLRSTGFPDARLKGYTFANDDRSNKSLSDIAQRYVDRFAENKKKNRQKGLLLYGAVGTGKTFMAAAIANALIDKGYPCLVTSFSRLINEITGAPFEDKQKYIDNLALYDLLVIDDLGAERDTDFANENIFNIVDARSRSGKPLILTTNLTKYEMLNATDIRRQRVYSRLFEMCIPIEVKGADRRRKHLINSVQTA